jgi:RHS repeat-associated protein
LRTSYSYDAANRLTGRQYQDGTLVTNTYDANSQRTVLSDLTGSYTSTYDPDGRVSALINPAGIAITYGYDAASQRASMNQPTGRFTYTHDAAGRITNLVNPEGQVTSWVYDKASRVLAMQMANGTLASNTYDNASQLLLLANLTTSGTTLSSFNYTYNPVGNRTQVIEANGDVLTLSYDPTSQLTNEKRSGANSYNISYTYDQVGNRVQLVNGGAVTTNTYNAGNELETSQASAGVTTSTYDGDGNLLTSLAPGNQCTTNTWDGENRLTQVALPTGIVDSFTYNGDGLRVQKIDSTGTTNHVWDGQNILLETNASNIIQVVYALQPVLYGNLISQARSGTTSFFLFDGLGSTTQLTDSTGSVTDSYLYDSFGNMLLTSGTTTNPFRYVGSVGYYADHDLGSYYLRARTYEPATGCFVSRDPSIRVGSYALARFRPYNYVNNNPAHSTDPGGLQSLGSECRFESLKFMAWYQQQKAAGTAWTASLPACPCNLPLGTVTQYRRFLFWSWGRKTIQKFVCPDTAIWSKPEPAMPTFHPGAHNCIRTKSPNAGGSGQQCCYDKQGALITHGRGAGTPDHTAPSIMLLPHTIDDVDAYNVANYLDTYCSAFPTNFVDLYIEVRPPNNANNCPTNP